MTIRRGLAVMVLTLGALVATPADASVRIGLGADYWVPEGGEFNLTLAVDGRLTRFLSVGGRFGALVTTSAVFGVPLDLDVRFHLPAHIYLEGLVGPWIVFQDFPVRFHGAVGFGFHVGGFEAGLEVGYATPGAMIGLKLAWSL